MDKKILIRGAAIACAGIAVSTFAAQHLLNKPPTGSAQVSRPAANDQPQQILGAGLISSGAQIAVAPDAPAQKADAVVVAAPELNLAALQEEGPTSNLFAGDDFNPRLTLAETEPQTAKAEAGAEADCSPSLSVKAGIDALIDLSVSAPCNAGERLVISHGDLAFSSFLSSEGIFSAFIPALTRDAHVDVFIGDDAFVQGSVEVEGVEEHVRVVLQWTGDTPLGMHAYHGEAGYGDDGHLHASRPFDTNLDEAFLISLGEVGGPEPMRAEVYSTPVAYAANARVEIELQYSDTVCGQDISAYVLQTGPSIDTDVKAMTFALPDCPAGNGVLVMELPLATPQHAGLAPLTSALDALR